MNMTEKMSGKEKLQLWAEQHENVLNGCSYNEKYLWISKEYVEEFVEYIKPHISGDFMNIPCRLQESDLCFRWGDILGGTYL